MYSSRKVRVSWRLDLCGGPRGEECEENRRLDRDLEEIGGHSCFPIDSIAPFARWPRGRSRILTSLARRRPRVRDSGSGLEACQESPGPITRVRLLADLLHGENPFRCLRMIQRLGRTCAFPSVVFHPGTPSPERELVSPSSAFILCKYPPYDNEIPSSPR